MGILTFTFQPNLLLKKLTNKLRFPQREIFNATLELIQAVGVAGKCLQAGIRGQI